MYAVKDYDTYLASTHLMHIPTNSGLIKILPLVLLLLLALHSLSVGFNILNSLYMRALRSLKRAAVCNLPIIDFCHTIITPFYCSH